MRSKGVVVAVVALVCILGVLLAPAAIAQEQRGSIEGVVKDPSGAVLPGVTVEARSAGGAVISTVTDSTGVFRFPSVLPGYYTVTATLSGFEPKKFDNVEVLLGQIKSLEFKLPIGGISESVTVTGESPLVDVRQSARATSIRAETLAMLPTGRDFMTVVTQAAGANNEAKSGGVMIDGATTSENRYIIDGAETSDLVNGGSGKVLLPDFLEEVQVKSSGYTAEYGGATGGVINVLTKSGTNSFRGNALFNFESTSAWGSPGIGSVGLPTLRLSPANADVAEYITYPKDEYYRVEPGFSVGGPLLPDRAWFFGAYQPTLRKYTRTVTSVDDPTKQVTTEQKRPAQYVTANETMQFGSKLRTRIAYNNSWSKTDGALASLDGSDPLGANYDYGDTFPNYSLSGQADWIARPNMFFSVRAGYYKSNQQSLNVPQGLRYLYRTSAIGYPGVPEEYQKGTNAQNFLTNLQTDFDIQKRVNFQVDGTWYGKLGGEHTIKAGFQVDHLANDVNLYETGPYAQIYYGESYRHMGVESGAYGYLRFRTNAAHFGEYGRETTGSVGTTNYGLFVQDAWTINRRLTVNIGLRTENETVLPYDSSLTNSVLKFGFGDKLAPRLGFAYDIKGDGRWKAYGSWGIFYDIFKMNLGRGSFGGEKWLEYWYTMESADLGEILNAINSTGCPSPSASTPDTCPSDLMQYIRGPYDYRYPGEFDPAIKPMKQREFSFGLEHQVSGPMAVSIRYVHKQVDRAIEDTGSYDPVIGEIYVIANPGFGATTIAWPDLNVPLPKAKRNYDSVEAAFTKNLSHNYYLRVSYMWSRLFGNYSGLDQTDENGRQSPNTGRLYDYPLMSFDEKGNPVEGPLATDRPHQVKAQFIYQLPFGASLGISQYVASGVPKSREMAVISGAGYPMFYKGRGSDGRMPMYSQTDLNLQHSVRLSAGRSVQVYFNVLNLFNQKTATSYYQTWTASGYYLDVPEGDIYAHVAPSFDQLAQEQALKQDPRFMQDNAWQLPRQARFGVKFFF